MKRQMIKGLLIALLVTIPTTSMATEFYKSGTVKRILADTGKYGKCMLQLPVTIGSSCSSTWVSLDCGGTYLPQGDGDRMLNIALVAQTMEKTISVKIDDTKKHSGFCVASRIDILQ